jgi:hypothetical protein
MRIAALPSVLMVALTFWQVLHRPCLHRLEIFTVAATSSSIEFWYRRAASVGGARRRTAHGKLKEVIQCLIQTLVRSQLWVYWLARFVASDNSRRPVRPQTMRAGFRHARDRGPQRTDAPMQLPMRSPCPHWISMLEQGMAESARAPPFSFHRLNLWDSIDALPRCLARPGRNRSCVCASTRGL